MTSRFLFSISYKSLLLLLLLGFVLPFIHNAANWGFSFAQSNCFGNEMQGWRDRKATIREDQDHVLNAVIFEAQIICNSTGLPPVYYWASLEKKAERGQMQKQLTFFYLLFGTNNRKCMAIQPMQIMNHMLPKNQTQRSTSTGSLLWITNPHFGLPYPPSWLRP